MPRGPKEVVDDPTLEADDVMPDACSWSQARAGDRPRLGRLLELYRNYLRLVARA